MAHSDGGAKPASAMNRMISTILRITGEERHRAAQALQAAGVSFIEARDAADAMHAIDQSAAALVVKDGELLAAADAEALAKAMAALSQAGKASLPRDAARTLSHELRTPLSAMSGWIHLMETGALDDAGLKRAISKLRGNIDDQVRTIDRYLGATTHEGQR